MESPSSIDTLRERVLASESPLVSLYREFCAWFRQPERDTALEPVFCTFGYSRQPDPLSTAVVITLDLPSGHGTRTDEQNVDQDDDGGYESLSDDDDGSMDLADADRYMPYISVELSRVVQRALIPRPWNELKKHPGFVHANCLTVHRVYLNGELRQRGYFKALIDELLRQPGVEAVMIESVLNKSWAKHMLGEDSGWICQEAPVFRECNLSFVRFNPSFRMDARTVLRGTS